MFVFVHLIHLVLLEPAFDPFLSLVTGSFEAVKNTDPYQRWGILGLAGIAFRVATVFCENTAQKFAGARSPIYGLESHPAVRL